MYSTSLHTAPFIWTPLQSIDPMGFQAVKGHVPQRRDGYNRWFLFRTLVEIAQTPDSAPVDITVDGRYLLFVNGEQIGRGPVRCSPLAQRYDSYEIGSRLKPGKNVIAVLVHTYGVDTAFYETTKGMWSHTFGDGGLWMNGPVVNTHQVWRCIQSEAWESDTPRVNHSLGFIESLDANRLPQGWLDAEFDDESWLVARPLLARGGGPESTYGGLIVRPFPTLVPRGIPQLEEREVLPERVLWTRSQTADASLPITHRIYDEKLKPLAEGMIAGLNNLLVIGGSGARISTSEQEDTAFLLDFGRILTGHPVLEIDAAGGEMIEIACSERLPGEWEAGGAKPEARITPFRVLGNDAHLCRYIARPGKQRFERFEWCAIRYMHVVIRNAPGGVTVNKIGATRSNYPVTERGRFSCSDQGLTRLWSLGAYTLRQCMHDAWEDCPGREQRQWLGDVTVENLAGWAAFGSSVAPLTAKFLIQVAESQRPDGLTQMFAPGDHFENGNLIPDWTLQWILCAADHWNLTADLATIETIWPSIQKALMWFERLRGPHGLIVDMPYWHFMDWAGVGREGEAAALNAQYAGTLRAAAQLADAVGFNAYATRYQEQADHIIAILNQRHWDEARGAWVDMVNPVNDCQLPRMSQHGNAAIALWGSAPIERVERALTRITDHARETRTPAPPVVPFGTALDEEHGVVMANTFYGHFVTEALARNGRVEAGLDQIRRRFMPMLEAGASTLWEAMSPWASLCHGFSASPTYFLSRHVLGVAPAAPGFSQIRIAPNLGDLIHAEGVVPVGAYDVEVWLERSDRGFAAWVSDVPGVEIAAAQGWRITSSVRRDQKWVVEYEPE
ncbi:MULTISPECIES: alpha-L-rhamnosidase N-terminal domain-containing protein [unclassified Duganella]|uniref:alpha-L-rhamnosidase-related protein n=1 Tax=unclassified Duganella TaxID=2636909 RepID=UPI000B872DE4|nr:MULTISPECIES: alpha-L-rhamnosidase N-terminal domain-containing protein [unclassified Duganella]